ncbi:hypothetical protein GYMLUDRAFT_65428 [Collybiopsis luxurians FD-317 M1]|uniref:Uncharacterized protein n=1 Tax=Collybiopsis luxurians FD-317 M1 TaxID=944289 RepID=A0A0D0B7N3_9AGAR|nr:hypothetical protein GYMLUDRAFT_65428 [Collybiopsis luxurians FD-317 M1]
MDSAPNQPLFMGGVIGQEDDISMEDHGLLTPSGSPSKLPNVTMDDMEDGESEALVKESDDKGERDGEDVKPLALSDDEAPKIFADIPGFKQLVIPKRSNFSYFPLRSLEETYLRADWDALITANNAKLDVFNAIPTIDLLTRSFPISLSSVLSQIPKL